VIVLKRAAAVAVAQGGGAGPGLLNELEASGGDARRLAAAGLARGSAAAGKPIGLGLLRPAASRRSWRGQEGRRFFPAGCRRWKAT